MSRGPSRRRLLGGAAALAATLGLPRRGWAAAGDRNLVIWWNAGGWDPSFVFDPHWDDAIDRDPLSVPATAAGIDFADAESRPAVRRTFERWGDRICVVNGIAVGSVSHEGASRLLLTGTRGGAADVGSLVATTALATHPLPYACLGNPRYPGAAGAVLTPIGPVLGGVVGDTEPAGAASSAAREALLLDYLEAEGEALGAGSGAASRLDGWQQALGRLRTLRQQPELLDVGAAPTAEELVEVGVELLAAGWCRVLGLRAPGADLARWDSHDSNQINQERCFEASFDGLGRLLEALAAIPDGGGSLLDRTTVLALSEMGRTPWLNSAQGKDHWPTTSAMVIGAGVGGGRVLGATDASLFAAPIDLASGAAHAKGTTLATHHLVAGVLAAFGLDPGVHLPGVEPFRAWEG